METDCEILRCSVQLAGCKTIYLGAYYRPHEDDEQSLLELERSLSLIKDHHHALLGGGFNLPGWDWKNHLVKKCNYPGLHYQFGDILDDKSLVQLDVAITNQPITVRDISVVLRVSDHDCPLITLDLKPVRLKQTPQKIPLYKRANWDSLTDELHVAKDIDTITTIRKDLKGLYHGTVQFILFNFANYSPSVAMELKVSKEITCK